MADLTKDNLIEAAKRKVYTQDYSPKTKIEGVELFPLKNHVGEDGDFSEIMRLNDSAHAQQIPGFKLAQINHTQIFAGAIKAWHLHLKQDEVWYLAPSKSLFVGLWDLRKDSKTSNAVMRLSLGGGNSNLLFIPQGVAHGYANFTNEQAHLYYFTNGKFDKKNPDEYRISWDAQGKEFWTPQRD